MQTVPEASLTPAIAPPPTTTSEPNPSLVITTGGPAKIIRLVPTHTIHDSADDYPELDTGSDGVDHNGISVGQWRQHLFGCIRSCVPNTCTAFLCPCVSAGQIAHRMGVGRFVPVLLSFGGLYITLLICLAASTAGGRGVALITGIGMWFYLYRLRATIRLAFQIPGSVLEDMCATVCCTVCSMSQMGAHIESFDSKNTCNLRPKSVLPGYNV
ncbi:hypothetical protein H257_16745 [Aphanomyces astaci]|uniref:Uncharacterized protein n=1 Tax=Aphanomyces astaci TaxID=112090 RepID=W4FJC0_APHAT|nr:hypothetical protein H257_16745 [Aphanomyces astaci]ETV66944.1 hypothetical protein H257_16745 [Aphanomyces astaci]|eukprot:XP_009843585.1 hypothetical protein H257_16745 [Aphanomyces astaci]